MSWSWDAFQKTRVSIVQAHLGLLRTLHGNRPVAARYWLSIRRLLGHCFLTSSALDLGRLSGRAEELAVPELRPLFRDEVLGRWSLDADSIALLWRELLEDRPETILEFGAGLSTLVLARYAAMESRRSVISIEQNMETMQQVEARLRSEGLARPVTILHAPTTAEGMYQLDTGSLSEALAGRRVEWILIDGPSGPPGCRVWTLEPILRFCANGARWFLDDAFRDGELRALETWMRRRNVHVEGIYPCGKGIAAGRIYPPLRVSGTI